MGFSGKLKAALSMKGENRLLFIEALFVSAYVRFGLSFFAYKKIMAWQGRPNTENTDVLSKDQQLIIGRVRHILQISMRYAFWKTECYTQALTAKILLRRRGVPSTLYIGFKKDNGQYEGHAWLKTPPGIVTGYINLDSYHVHAYFS